MSSSSRAIHHRGTPLLAAARKAGARLTVVLAAITGSLLGTAPGVPAAFAGPVPPPGGSYAPGAPVPATIIHVITTGGMAGWQITQGPVAALQAQLLDVGAVCRLLAERIK